MKKFLLITFALCLPIVFVQRVHYRWQNPIRSLQAKPHECPKGYEELYSCKDLEPVQNHWDQYGL